MILWQNLSLDICDNFGKRSIDIMIKTEKLKNMAMIYCNIQNEGKTVKISLNANYAEIITMMMQKNGEKNGYDSMLQTIRVTYSHDIFT